MGLFLEPPKKAGQDDSAEDNSLVDGLMNLIIRIRANARQNKDWATSDLIRNNLAALGFEVKDTKDGFTWKLSL